jgi:hypothetical protein
MNDAIRIEREKQIHGWLVGKSIRTVRYYFMNRNTYLHPDSPQQLVDAGIEFELHTDEYITFGWNFEYAILDIYTNRFIDTLKAFNNEMPYLEKTVNEDAQWKTLLDKEIKEIKFAWNWFIDMDENTHYVPQDIEMHLQDEKYIAICTTAYTVDEEGISILHPDSEGELLVLFNEEDTRFYKRGSYYEAPVETPEDTTAHGDEESF